MASLESINEKLQVAAERLDQAANEIAGLPLEPTKEHVVRIGEALAKIFQIQHEIIVCVRICSPHTFRKQHHSQIPI